MKIARVAAALAVSFSLTACQTMPLINGFNIHPAQGGFDDGFCGRNLLLCMAGGGLLAGGVALAAASGSYHHNYSGTSGSMSGSSGSMSGGGY